MAWTALLLTGCGADSDSASSDDSPTTETSSSATTPSEPTTEASVVPVSLQTACQLAGNDRILQRAQREISTFVDHPDLSQTDAETLGRIVRDIEDVAVRSPDRLSAQFGALAQPLRDLIAGIKAQENQTIDLQGYRAAGLEIVNLCGTDLF